MPTTKNLVTFVAGAASSLVIILSCGDQTPQRVDAAVSCDCPLAEAPLAGRIVEVVFPLTLPSANAMEMGKGGSGVDCPEGAILLSGGCAASTGAVPDIVVEASFPADTSWVCSWKNNGTNRVAVRAIARCLIPATPAAPTP